MAEALRLVRNTEEAHPSCATTIRLINGVPFLLTIWTASEWEQIPFEMRPRLAQRCGPYIIDLQPADD
jgi:hypothetical protein